MSDHCNIVNNAELATSIISRMLGREIKTRHPGGYVPRGKFLELTNMGSAYLLPCEAEKVAHIAVAKWSPRGFVFSHIGLDLVDETLYSIVKARAGEDVWFKGKDMSFYLDSLIEQDGESATALGRESDMFLMEKTDYVIKWTKSVELTHLDLEPLPILSVDSYKKVIEELLGVEFSTGDVYISDILGPLAIVNGSRSANRSLHNSPFTNVADIRGVVVDVSTKRIITKAFPRSDVCHTDTLRPSVDEGGNVVFETKEGATIAVVPDTINYFRSYRGITVNYFKYMGVVFCTTLKRFRATACTFGSSSRFGELAESAPFLYDLFDLESEEDRNTYSVTVVDPDMRTGSLFNEEMPGYIFVGHYDNKQGEQGAPEQEMWEGANFEQPLTEEEALDFLRGGFSGKAGYPPTIDGVVEERLGRGEPLFMSGKSPDGKDVRLQLEPTSFRYRANINPTNLRGYENYIVNNQKGELLKKDLVLFDVDVMNLENLLDEEGEIASDVNLRLYKKFPHQRRKQLLLWAMNILFSVPPRLRHDVAQYYYSYCQDISEVVDWIYKTPTTQLVTRAAQIKRSTNNSYEKQKEIRNLLFKEYGTSLYYLFLMKNRAHKAKGNFACGTCS